MKIAAAAIALCCAVAPLNVASALDEETAFHFRVGARSALSCLESSEGATDGQRLESFSQCLEGADDPSEIGSADGKLEPEMAALYIASYYLAVQTWGDLSRFKGISALTVRALGESYQVGAIVLKKRHIPISALCRSAPWMDCRRMPPVPPPYPDLPRQ